MKTSHAIAFAAALVLCGGCASTIESRIKANPGLFASFPPEAQEKIRRERVELGFTEDMVRVALGSPSRISTRVTESGTTTLWFYTSHEPETHSDMVPVTYYGRDGRGRMRAYSDFAWVDRTYWRERDSSRVEFRDGKVVGIETTGRR